MIEIISKRLSSCPEGIKELAEYVLKLVEENPSASDNSLKNIINSKAKTISEKKEIEE
jgi:hypothetical protein